MSSSLIISSTTDSPEAVQAAMGLHKEGKAKEQENPSAPDSKESGQNETAKSDLAEKEEPEQEEQASKEDEGDESESDGEAEKKEDSDKDKPKKRSGWQRRIDKLNARTSAAKQEADYWKSVALKQGADASKGAPQVEKTVTKEPEGKPNQDKFETNAEYVDALTDWKLEQRDKAREERETRDRVKSEQATVFKSHTERVEAFSKKTSDFMDVLEEVEDVSMSPAVQQILVESDNGPELMYELAKNREEFERINKLTPLAAARELGRIESKLAAQAAPKTDPKKITKAPQPPTPINASGGSAEKDPSEMPYQEFKKWRKAQLSRR